VFAPRNPAEVARVLRPAGVLVVATPEPDHLRELVGTLGLLGVQARKRERLAAAHSGMFDAERAVRWRHRLSLPASDVAALAGMGPSAHHTDPEQLRRDAAALPDPVDVTAAVTVTVFRRR
jgi:23S rRNA (guanine745-N1)-methyltransferase